MPTTRRRRRQEVRGLLEASMQAFFETGSYDTARAAGIAAGEANDGGFRGMLQLFVKGRAHAALWHEHADDIVADWTAEHPGTRPWAWWHCDASEPRRRLGGIGTPAHEALAYVPAMEFGIPATWVEPWMPEYYGADFRGLPIDPDDPPRYESQAAYLKRLGLLTPEERQALGPEDFAPEVVRPADDEHDSADEGGTDGDD